MSPRSGVATRRTGTGSKRSIPGVPRSAARVTVRFILNGKRTSVRVPPMKRLLDTLREDLRLTGSKEGCGEGECGACSVRVDGRTVCSCLMPTVQAEGAKIVTIEGLAGRRELSILQQVFLEGGGAQCGICTPGILVTSAELLERAKGRVPSDAEVREALGGNLCRCTGYQRIVDSVREAARVSLGRGRQGARARGRAKASTKRRAPARGKNR